MPWNATTQDQYRRPMDRFETDVTDAERAVIEPLLPPPSRLGRPRTLDVREVVNALQFILGTGCQWRSLPKCCPPFASVQNCFYAWRDDGTLERMLDALRTQARTLAGRAAAPTAAAIDSPLFPLPGVNTEMGGPSGDDAGKRSKGRQRHLTVDVEGFPIMMAIQPASVQDRDGAPEVIFGMLAKAPQIRKLWADGGHTGPKLRAALAEGGLGALIESVHQPKAIKGFTVLYRRWVVERTLAWLSRCRRLARDVERTVESSLAWVPRAACRCLMRRVARGLTS